MPGERGMLFLHHGAECFPLRVRQLARRGALDCLRRNATAAVTVAARLRQCLTEMFGEITGKASAIGRDRRHALQTREICQLPLMEPLDVVRGQFPQGTRILFETLPQPHAGNTERNIP